MKRCSEATRRRTPRAVPRRGDSRKSFRADWPRNPSTLPVRFSHAIRPGWPTSRSRRSLTRQAHMRRSGDFAGRRRTSARIGTPRSGATKPEPLGLPVLPRGKSRPIRNRPSEIRCSSKAKPRGRIHARRRGAPFDPPAPPAGRDSIDPESIVVGEYAYALELFLQSFDLRRVCRRLFQEI